MSQQTRILVTGASGQLGRLVVAALLKRVNAAQIVALVRGAEAAKSFADQGIEARIGNYDDTTSLAAALTGIDRVLLISSSELGKRDTQHGNVINAAKAAGVKLLAYTSLLRADTSIMGLAEDHLFTEKALRASGVPFTFLRNGWYLENQTAGAAGAVEHQALMGSAGEGRFSAAARADYAEAAAVVLASADDQAGKIYELAGDTGYTQAELAAEIARQAGTPVNYVYLPEAEYRAALEGFGLPAEIAALLAASDAAASTGSLFDDGRALSKLIGRPTTTLAQAVSAALGR